MKKFLTCFLVAVLFSTITQYLISQEVDKEDEEEKKQLAVQVEEEDEEWLREQETVIVVGSRTFRQRQLGFTFEKSALLDVSSIPQNAYETEFENECLIGQIFCRDVPHTVLDIEAYLEENENAVLARDPLIDLFMRRSLPFFGPEFPGQPEIPAFKQSQKNKIKITTPRRLFSRAPELSDEFREAMLRELFRRGKKETDWLPIEVSFRCPVCETGSTKVRTVKYWPLSGGLQRVSFDFTPVEVSSDQNGHDGFVAFELGFSFEGVLYTEVNLFAVVLSDQEYERYAVRGRAVLNDYAFQIQNFPFGFQSSRYSDVEFIMTPTEGGELGLKIIPHHPELRDQYRRLLQDGNEWMDLPTNLQLSDLQGQSLSARLRPLNALTSGAKGDCVPNLGLTNYKTASQRCKYETTVRSVFSVGGNMHRDIFSDPTAVRFANQMEEIAEALDRPFVIHIRTDGLLFPFQTLHRGLGEFRKDFSDHVSFTQNSKQKIDPTQFWGLKYEVIIQPQWPGISENVDPSIEPLDSDNLIFGSYEGPVTPNVFKDALSLVLHLLKLDDSIMPSPSVFRTTTKAFLAALTERDEVAHIVVYGHGASGQIVTTQNSSRSETVAPALLGQSLMFGDSVGTGKADRLYSQDLRYYGLLSEPASGNYLLDDRPIVYLFGCETGSAWSPRDKWNSFVGAFQALGARGILVSEVNLDTALAHQYGKSLFRELDQRKSISQAIYDIRNSYFIELRNLAPLLITYYGEAATTYED